MTGIMLLKFRRRRESLTDYRKRLNLVKSGMDRIIIRKTNKRIIGQVSRYEEKGDRTVAYADSNELRAMGWPSRSNKPTAYLTGMLLAKKIGKSESQKEHILDIGISSPVKGSVSFVFAKGCIDGGMKLRGKFDIAESEYNYSNSKYAAELKSKNPERYRLQYGAYIENKTEPESLHKLFVEVKQKISAK